jgi:hypothetical protein
MLYTPKPYWTGEVLGFLAGCSKNYYKNINTMNLCRQTATF